MTVLGTRPEIIRLSLLIAKLDAACEHVLVNTGQNFDPNLSDIFFRELGVRAPDEHLGVRGNSPAEIMAQVIERSERAILKHRPDRLLILGDTYSGLSAVIARRMQIPVFHMEAGNRCFDFRVPEEVNRRIIDHVSSVLLPYTERSRDNLLREGFASQDVHVTGNPIKEVLDHFAPQIGASAALTQHQVRSRGYILATVHRAENVDDPARLTGILTGLERVAAALEVPVIASVHPRTRERLKQQQFTASQNLRFCEPFGLFDFVNLEQNALLLISDSGTVQEEACIFGVPAVTVRDVTERPETVECGSNILAGADPERILALSLQAVRSTATWKVPPEYLATNVSDVVLRILLGYRRD